MDELEQAKLEMESLLLAVVEVVEGAENYLEVAGELLLGEQKGCARGAGAFIAGYLKELSVFTAKTGHEGVAQVADELAGERAGAVAGVEQDVELAHQLGGTAGRDRLEDSLEDGVGNRAH